MITWINFIVENQLQSLYFMDSGNADTWHNHMYESCTLIAKNVVQCVACFW
jgi:hypothetical protein